MKNIDIAFKRMNSKDIEFMKYTRSIIWHEYEPGSSLKRTAKYLINSCKLFANRKFYKLISALYESRYKDYFLSYEETILPGELVLNLKLKSKLFNRNIAIKAPQYEKKSTASLEYDLYSKFRKIFKHDPSVEIPEPITYFEDEPVGEKHWGIKKKSYFPLGVLITQCADCTPLVSILENKEKYGKKFSEDILNKIIKTTSKVHIALKEVLESKDIRSLRRWQDFNKNLYLSQIKHKFNLDLEDVRFRPILDFLDHFLIHYRQTWIKDIKPANWGYNFKNDKLVLFDFDSLEEHPPQWDWSKFIDNETLDGYDRKEILERFLDYNSEDNKDRELNKKLYYYCSFIKNCIYSPGFFDVTGDFSKIDSTEGIKYKERKVLHSLVRHRFQRALDSLEYIINNYDDNVGFFRIRYNLKKALAYNPYSFIANNGPDKP